MNYKISIITICFNASDGLSKTITSVRQQSFTDYEYIIVDGASNDNTLDVIKQNEDVITHWVSEPDKGIYDAMNKGIKMAHGEWVIMMNAGDIFADSEVLTNVFKYPIPEDKTFLYSNAMCVLADGRKFLGECDFERGLLLHQSIIYRKSLHDEHGYYIVTPRLIISDYLFFIRIPKEQVLKVDTTICLFEGGGVSQKFRSGEYAKCADYIFHRRSFANTVKVVLKGRLMELVPPKIRLTLKRLLHRKRYV